jgi:hypothetical protein
MEIRRSCRIFYTSPITTIRNGNPEKWPEFLYFPYNDYQEWKIQRSGQNLYISPITTISNGNPEKLPQFLYFPYNGYPTSS